MLEGLTPPKKKTGCKVGQISAELEPSDKEIFLKAIADTQNWSHEALANALRERGLDISYGSIQRHRVGKCRHD